MACACTFLGLMSLRALVAICAGERIADRLALVLQFVTIVLLVETFLFLPAVLPDIIDAMQEGRASYAWVPPVWFVALFIWMAEGTSFLSDHIVKAVAVTASVTGLVVLVSLLPAAWMGRRVLEVRTIERASGLALLARRIALLWVRDRSCAACSCSAWRVSCGVAGTRSCWPRISVWRSPSLC